MEKAQSPLVVSVAFFLLCIAAAGAFGPVPRPHHGRISASSALHSEQQRSEDDGPAAANNYYNSLQRRSDFLALLGTAVTGSAVVSSAEPAQATVPLYPSSSVYLAAEEIKTFDLSLPSYDSINTLKADEKALGVEGAPEPAAKGSKKKAKIKSESSGGDSMLSSVLPSMNKSGPSKKPKPAKKEKAPKPERAEAPTKAEIETMDFSLPSYSKETEAKEKDFFAL
mmetsp:Transcript_16723/g.38357  ORF Transcript_16723/g.38357 Transcript_16723/m.38357 type:complete len:225 (+) Transcript_16723:203-877(+)